MEDSTVEIRQLDLSRPVTARTVKSFLDDAGLRLDESAAYFAGMFDTEDRLIGCGGLDSNIIKCLAMSSDARSEGLSAKLITHLMNEAFSSGHSNVRVFTKPVYKPLFKSLGFTMCGESSSAIWLESDSLCLRKYRAYLSDHPADGVIVANTDPVTLGHLYLITRAASQCHRLAVITVGANRRNCFSYQTRKAMLKRAVSHLANVEILDGSEYVISQLSFPSYFIKKADTISRAQAELDLDIFCRNIAPSLGAVRRFVGTEPVDALTAQYNELMKEILPLHGIEVVEIPRMTDAGGVISASRVRKALTDGRSEDAIASVPRSNVPYFLAWLAVRSLRKELELAPKPGLVDPFDNGSHTDMDFDLMSRSIDSLQDYFTELAVTAYDSEAIDSPTLRRLGLEAEKKMLEATGGVNTHRGAIFSMGLAVAATAKILGGKSQLTLGREIARLANGLTSPPDTTHGGEVRRRYGISGAMENARAGYPLLFDEWLPFYRGTQRSDADRLRLLMKIIAGMDDSNAIFRAGPEKAAEARLKAAKLADGDCDTRSLEQLNEEFKRERISHGGAADMLALTFFADSVCNLSDL